MIVGLSLMVLIVGAGVAIDMTRAQMMQTRLQSAIDASGLASLNSLTRAPSNVDKEAYVNTEAKRIFNMNFPAGYMDTDPANITTELSADGTGVTVRAAVTQGTSLMKVFGLDNVTVGAHSATESISNSSTTELVLVLDNTYSMNECVDSGSLCTGNPNSKMEVLRTAAKNLLDIVYGATNDTVPGLYVSVIPFSHAVNIGTSRLNWIEGLAPDLTEKSGADLVNSYDWGPGGHWAGCVTVPYYPDARFSWGGAEMELDDYPPVSGLKRNVYWFSPEPGIEFPYADANTKFTGTLNGITYNNKYVHEILSGNDMNGYGYWWNYNPETPGWATWRKTGWRDDSVTPSTYMSPLDPRTVGPNLGCPSTLLQLSSSKAAAKAAIDAMYPTGDSTIASEGIAWTIHMLSPAWRGQWGGEMDANNLPTDYNQNNSRKIVVFMSDGWNRYLAYDYTAFGQLTTMAAMWGWGVFAWDISAYGIPMSYGEYIAQSILNNNTEYGCSLLKRNGVKVYTIGFGRDGGPDDGGTVNKDLLQSCASSADTFFLAPTNEELEKAFQAIGRSLLALRVSQ